MLEIHVIALFLLSSISNVILLLPIKAMDVSNTTLNTTIVNTTIVNTTIVNTTTNTSIINTTKEEEANLQQKQPLLLFFGTVLTEMGWSVPNATIQFWHTDVTGQYDHPQDGRAPPSYYQNFQYYGTSTTNEVGNFLFWTYRPGRYSGRPITHIHYKVFVNGSTDDIVDTTTTTTSSSRIEVLTSQFYFSDEDIALSYPTSLLLDLIPMADVVGTGSLDQFNTTNGRVYDYLINQTIVIDSSSTTNTASSSGSSSSSVIMDENALPLQLTPSQQEGPFYPVVDFFDIGYDMTQPSPMASMAATSPEPSSSSAVIGGTIQQHTGGSSSFSSSSQWLMRTMMMMLLWQSLVTTLLLLLMVG
jgi:protocatechuate 3,4-dioxygenase beta subunit